MIPYIIKALLKNESVCVNDLGTFTMHYVPASIQGKTILAPHNEITLDTNNVYDEYAFTNLVCFEKKCLITQANQDITQWVEELKNALEHNKSVSFDQFGTFAMNDKGKISFTCDYIPELNQEFEGMEDLSTVMLWKGNEEEKEVVSENDSEDNREDVKVGEPEVEPEPVVEVNEEEHKEEAKEEAPEVETVEEEEPEEQNPDADDQEDRTPDTVETDDGKRHRSRWWLWLLIVFLLLAALGTAGYLLRDQIRPVIDNVKEKLSKKEQVVEPSEPAESETIDVIEPEENVEEEIAEEEPAPQAYMPETVKKTADGKYPYIRFETGHFYTIVGSLPSETDAEKHIRNRGLDKYDPKLVLQNGVGNIRVCVGIFDSEEEAEAFGKNTGLKYWVLK
ncbi:MAG: hypothetical protein J5730_01100 [Bacteroidales bacterium]|nr:hypothetical protein [Bacteroidales bacterium]